MNAERDRPNRKNVFIMMAVLCVAAGLLYASFQLSGDPPETSEHAAQRVVSMAPSITEVIFAMGEGDRVVGVSSYTTFPPEARVIRALGGHIDPDLEGLVSVAPDVVFTMGRLDKVHHQTGALGVRTVEVPMDTLDQILDGIDIIAAELSNHGAGTALRHELEAGLARLQAQPSAPTYAQFDGRAPRVLLVIGRDATSLGSMYVAGPPSFLSELLALVGAKLAMEHPELDAAFATAKWPQLAVELLPVIDPDIIIELAAPDGADPDVGGRTSEAYRDQEVHDIWAASLPNLRAVKGNHIYVIRADGVFIPGPRIVKTARHFATIVHGRAPD